MNYEKLWHNLQIVFAQLKRQAIANGQDDGFAHQALVCMAKLEMEERTRVAKEGEHGGI